MPDVSYIIKIESDSGGSNDTPKRVASTEYDVPRGKTNKITSVAGVSYALKAVDTVITNSINMVSMTEGHTILADKIAWSYSTAKRTAGIMSGLAISVITGNPIAAAATAGAIADRALSLMFANEQMSKSKSIEKVGIAQANIRAGSNGGRRE